MTARDEAEIEASRAPLMDHLIELRGRLIVCVIAFILCFFVCFFFAAQIQIFLIKPFQAAAALHAVAQAEGGHSGGNPFELIAITSGLRPFPAGSQSAVALIATAPLEQLFTKMKIAGFGAIVLAFPVLAWQLYRFVAPGLYRNEKGAFLPFLFAAPFLFMLGGALVYFVMLPFVMWFSLSQQISADGISVELMTKISEYLSLVTSLMLAFGLCFQLPIVTTLLGIAGLISSKMMSEGRRYAIVAIVVVAAVVTPPDPLSQIMLAVPLVLLYEVSIWCVRLIELRKKKADDIEGLAGA
ncbi:twin-arginine translocase subunit TatC [Brevundimonas variabilis]|uniref:Sec-independent protein translocase protein TatC n=1 Tax=Brevundimonas variabilis TaxID=74312 RepID=A0A7W9CI18_9CAUL|nr:twin-arginine translocase subunit TatC [Brevundimonas variabilis]MBB5745851.1 sec-independent protein translocase protein TatC [Brevundimonas variabilis]